MIRNRWSTLVLLAPLLTIGFVASTHAADSCQPVFDAMSKVLVTSSHVFSTEGAGTRAGAKPQSESIYFGGAIYVKLNDKWIRSKMTAQQMRSREKENRRHGTATCPYLRAELA